MQIITCYTVSLQQIFIFNMFKCLTIEVQLQHWKLLTVIFKMLTRAF